MHDAAGRHDWGVGVAEEVGLGNSDTAYALATSAREMAPNDPLVKLLFAYLPSEERRE